MGTELIPVEIADKRTLAEDIAGLDLVAATDATLPGFSAGAHIDVHLSDGMVRQYSLWNDPAERGRYRIGVLREADGRGGSQRMHDLETGNRLRVSAPRNSFPLAEQGTRAILLAGGIGITPLLAMAYALQARGDDFRLHYCARSAARMAFRDLLEQAPFADRVRLHLDDGPAAQRFAMQSLKIPPDARTHLYVCGPTGFMDAALAVAAGGWAPETLHREYFSADGAAPRAKDSAFRVRLGHDGPEYAIPADRSIADVLSEAGIEVPMSCEQGICGTCLTPVLGGVPDHRDHVMTAEEHAANDQITLCCSRSRSQILVIDI